VSDSSYFEIVLLENGDFALQPAGGSSEHLVKISFGVDAKAYLAEQDVTVARAMIQAAIQTVGVLREQAIKRKKDVEESRILH
jgi:hypothetical protein